MKYVCRDCKFQSEDNAEAWQHGIAVGHRFFSKFAPTEPSGFSKPLEIPEDFNLNPEEIANKPAYEPSSVKEAYKEDLTKFVETFLKLESVIAVSIVKVQSEGVVLNDNLIFKALIDMARAFCEENKTDFLQCVVESQIGINKSFFLEALRSMRKEQVFKEEEKKEGTEGDSTIH